MSLSHDAIKWLLDLLMVKTAQYIRPLVLQQPPGDSDLTQQRDLDNSPIQPGSDDPLRPRQLTLHNAGPMRTSINDLFNPQWSYFPGKGSTPKGSWNQFSHVESASDALFDPRQRYPFYRDSVPLVFGTITSPLFGQAGHPFRNQSPPRPASNLSSNLPSAIRPAHELLNAGRHESHLRAYVMEPKQELVPYLTKSYNEAVDDKSLRDINLFSFADSGVILEEYLKLLAGQNNLFYRLNLANPFHEHPLLLKWLKFLGMPGSPAVFNSPFALFRALNRTIDQYRYVQGHPTFGFASTVVHGINDLAQIVPTPTETVSTVFGYPPNYNLFATATYGSGNYNAPSDYAAAVVSWVGQPRTAPRLYNPVASNPGELGSITGLLVSQYLQSRPGELAKTLGKAGAKYFFWYISLPDIAKDVIGGIAGIWRTVQNDPNYRQMTFNNTVTHFACRAPIIGPDGRLSTFWDASYDIPQMIQNPVMSSFFSTKVAAGALGIWPDDPEYRDVVSAVSAHIPERVSKLQREMSPTHRLPRESMSILTLTAPLLFPNTNVAPIIHIYGDRVEEREVLHGIIEAYSQMPPADARARRGYALLALYQGALRQSDDVISGKYEGDLHRAASGRGLKYQVLPKLILVRYFGSAVAAASLDPGNDTLLQQIKTEIDNLRPSEAELARYTFRVLSYMGVDTDKRGDVWFKVDKDKVSDEVNKDKISAEFYKDAAKFSVLLEWYLRQGAYENGAKRPTNPHLDAPRKAEDIAQRLIRDLSRVQTDKDVARAMQDPTIQHLIFSRIFNAEWVATQLATSSSEDDRNKILETVYQYSPVIAKHASKLVANREWAPQQYCTINVGPALDRQLTTLHFAIAAAWKDAEVDAAFTPLDRSLGAFSKNIAYQWVPQSKLMVGIFEAKDLISVVPLFRQRWHRALPWAIGVSGAFHGMEDASRTRAIKRTMKELEHGESLVQLLYEPAPRTGGFIQLVRSLQPH